MKTLSYFGIQKQKIAIGKNYFFGQLWDGNYDGSEILESGSIAMKTEDEEKIIFFEIIEENEDILETLVKITDIL